MVGLCEGDALPDGVECAMYKFEALVIALVRRVVVPEMAWLECEMANVSDIGERELEEKERERKDSTYLTKTAVFTIQSRSSGAMVLTRTSSSRSPSCISAPSGTSTTSVSCSRPLSPIDGSS